MRKHPSLSRADVFVATWFGSGFLPKAPGTWGSLMALPFAWAILLIGGKPALAVAALAVFFLGWWASSRYAALVERDDPGEVVVDEVVGQWLTLLAGGLDLSSFVFGFVLFRLFDILKPWPVSWADRKIGGGLGIMLDDVFAGLYAFLILFSLRYFGS